jgi:glycerol transport system ATP-binding protein
LGAQPVAFKLPDALRARLDDARTAGVRPEAIGLAADSADADAVRATVEHLESLGHETLAHVRVAGGAGTDDVRLVARLEGMHGFARGETVRLHVDPARVYLFGEDGAALPGLDVGRA